MKPIEHISQKRYWQFSRGLKYVKKQDGTLKGKYMTGDEYDAPFDALVLKQHFQGLKRFGFDAVRKPTPCVVIDVDVPGADVVGAFSHLPCVIYESKSGAQNVMFTFKEPQSDIDWKHLTGWQTEIARRLDGDKEKIEILPDNKNPTLNFPGFGIESDYPEKLKILHPENIESGDQLLARLSGMALPSAEALTQLKPKFGGITRVEREHPTPAKAPLPPEPPAFTGSRLAEQASFCLDAIDRPDDYHTWISVALALKAAFCGQHDDDEGFKLWCEWSQTADEHDSEEDLRSKWNSLRPSEEAGDLKPLALMARKYGLKLGGEDLDCNDETVTALFMDRFGKHYRFVPQEEKTRRWYVYQCATGHWVPQSSLAVELSELAEEWNKQARRYEDAAKNTDGLPQFVAEAFMKKASKARGFRDRLRGHNGLTDFEKYLPQRYPVIERSLTEFDQAPHFAGVKNGILHLLSGQLVDPNPNLYISKILNASFEPDAQCELTERFIAGMGETAEDMQRIAGYCLRHDNPLNACFFIDGAAGTGKSTFIKSLSRLMGSLARSTNLAVFKHSRPNGPSPDLANIYGLRMAFVPEVEGGKLHNSAIKNATGGDEVTARHLNSPPFNFVPADTKLILYGNETPNIQGVDEALRDRIKVVKWRAVRFRGEQGVIPKIAERMNTAALLNWVLAGYMEVGKRGLNLSDLVQADSAEYFEEQDIHKQFIDECMVPLVQAVGASANTSYVPFKQIYRAWCQWMTYRGMREEINSEGPTAKRLKAAGLPLTKIKDRTKASIVQGWAINTEAMLEISKNTNDSDYWSREGDDRGFSYIKVISKNQKLVFQDRL
ncbi:MAG: phage/plasmid primase, P4 family [Pseudomonadaceae bacterium]|nr:phage/plasmid primase, P4 family [Pseudomonadaceae bacterium]